MDPTKLSTCQIVTTWKEGDDRNFTDVIHWKCRDPRYRIRAKGTTDLSLEIPAECTWYRNYTLQPSQLECKVQFCNNPITSVNTNGHNFNFTWDKTLTKIGDYLTYPCKDGMAFESNVKHQLDSPTFVKVLCQKNGRYKYPYPWPQCSNITYCGPPPSLPEGGYNVPSSPPSLTLLPILTGKMF